MSEQNIDASWPLYEVFVRSSRGLSHVHAGSLHAPDDTMALRNARDLYTRRNEGTSVWWAPAKGTSSPGPDSKAASLESPKGKAFGLRPTHNKPTGGNHP